MKITNNDIVKFLAGHSGWHQASVLATQFGVTKRTIRNHISKLNENRQVIESGPLGYRIKEMQNKMVVNGAYKEDMTHQVFNLLFAAPNGRMRLTDIMEQTFFSEITIQGMVSSFNKQHIQEGIQINLRKGYLNISGSEYNQRKLFHKYAGQRIKNFPQSVSLDLKQLIPDISVRQLKEIIISTANKQDLVINGYEMENLLLHYAISINCIENGNSYKVFQANNNLANRKEYQLTLEITKRISERYHLIFNDFEIQALTLALIGKTIIKDASSKQFSDLSKYVPKNIIDVCLQVITNVSREYGLQLNNPGFLVRFIIHVKNMVDRVSYKNQLETKDLDYLRQQYPLLYEMALFVLTDLNDKLDITIDPSESIFLLLHLGSNLENNKIRMIDTIVITPNYYNTGDQLEQKLIDEFGDELHITVLSSEMVDKLQELDAKLILTTVNTNIKNNHVVKISPLLTGMDMSRIRKAINQIKHDKKVTINMQNLQKYTSERLFFSQTNFKNKEECLRFGTKQLYDLGYTNERFFNEILIREKLAATNFENVAIPHTLKMKAEYTGVLVMIDQNGIEWNKNENCNLIIMIAVSQEEIHVFGDLFQALISVLSIKKNINELVQSSNYQRFIETLSEQIKNDQQII